jgi:hypothetical protein
MSAIAIDINNAGNSYADKNRKALEQLFVKMYGADDLRSDVLGFIQPFILSANNLLSNNGNNHKISHNNNSSNSNKGTTKDARFSEESFIHLDMETQRKLENILYRDLPNLLDDYLELPINYRNQKKLISGKTHRETLIENIELLANQIHHLENTSFANEDAKARVKSKVLQERYGLEFEPQADEAITLQSTFDFNDYQKVNEKVLQLGRDHMKASSNEANRPAMEYQVRIENGQVEYRVKKNFKSFMSATYSLANKMVDSLASKAEHVQTSISYTSHRLRKKKGSLLIAFTALAITAGVVEAGMNSQYLIQASQNNFMTDSTILDDVRDLSHQENWHYDEGRAKNVQMFEKMMSPQSTYYMKGWSFTNEDGSDIAIDPASKTAKNTQGVNIDSYNNDKQYVVATLSKISKSSCQEVLSDWYWNTTQNNDIMINQHLSHRTYDLDAKKQAAQLCDLPSNQISFKLRVK